MKDGLVMAGNILAELMTMYETSVQDLSMGLRALEYKADTIRDALGAPNLGISRDLATPTAWDTIASLSNKVEKFDSIEIVTPYKLAKEIALSKSKLKANLDQQVKEIAHTKAASVEAQIADLKSTLLQSVKVIQTRIGQEHGKIFRLESIMEKTMRAEASHQSNPL
jgi:hypothetical protein